MPDFYIEPEKKLPVFANVDVLVCGGGPAGIASAVSAAKNGCLLYTSGSHTLPGALQLYGIR